MSGIDTQAPRELDHRRTNGLDVTLLWYEREDVASVVVHDTGAGTAFELVLGDGDNALDVFRHPLAYAAHRGLEHALPSGERDHAIPA